MSKKLDKFLKEADEAVQAAPAGDLVAAVERVLADGFVFYYKSHSFHWNVEGSDFSEFHGFFGDIYDQVHDGLDRVAEEIRALGSYAPRSFSQLLAITSIIENKTQYSNSNNDK